MRLAKLLQLLLLLRLEGGGDEPYLVVCVRCHHCAIATSQMPLHDAAMSTLPSLYGIDCRFQRRHLRFCSVTVSSD